MRVFLAGGTGVIGRSLLPRLVAAGHQVTGLARSAGGVACLTAAGAEAAVADVFDAGALTGALRQAAPEVVVHQLTALGDRDFAANARIREAGTRNLVDAARAAGARRIVAQSIAWAYAAGDAPAAEDEPLDLAAPAPRSGTVAGVVALESAVRELPEWVVLRLGLLYGPGTWYSPDGAMAGTARAGKLPADADVSSFLHVEDAAAAAMAAMAWPTGAVNVVDDEPAAGYDWAPAFRAAAGAPEPARAGGERHGWARGASNRYAREQLGWTPAHRSWRTGFDFPQ
jgi:nucleoside-diphosphate-sugar epimerase